MRDRASNRVGSARLDVIADMLTLGGRSLGFLVIMAGFAAGLGIIAGAF